jgi:hypothetical protein
MDTLSAILSGIWTMMEFLFGIPIIGFFLQLAFFSAIVWMIYRYTPGPVRRRFVPYLSSGTRIPRNMLARKIGDADIFRQPGDAKPQIIYEKVAVPRSFRSNFWLRARWWILGIASLWAAQNQEIIRSFISSISS